MAPSTKETVETVWYRNTEFDTLVEVVKGSDTEKRLRTELRQVGETEDDVERAYERVDHKTLAGAQKDPSKLPGFVKDPHPALPAAGTVVVTQGEGPSETDVQARIDEAVKASEDRFAELLAGLQSGEGPSEADGSETPAPTPDKK